ncbi:6-phosphogluconolactonase, partial [Leucobacter sp. M11]|uniref:6-phosphogluconolactonase n=1 Tax=Leucobacter sp. M11 TaxID=2993565 RepID=UPI002D7F91AE
SPKPPAERLSLSLTEINRAERVWLFVAGEEKREAFLAAAADRPAPGERPRPGAALPAAPAARVRGRAETVLYADDAAADHAAADDAAADHAAADSATTPAVTR